MQRATARLTPEMRAAWVEALGALRTSMTDDAIEQLLISGRINDVLTPELLNDVFAGMRRQLLRGVQQGASAIVTVLPDSAQVAFTTRANPRVIEAIRALDAFLLRPLREELRETVRLGVENGLRAGQNPRAIARELREVIGLAPNQIAEVNNYRQALIDRRVGKALQYKLRDKRFDKTVQKGTYDAKKIDTMVARYRVRREADHANTIARTATLNANRAGAHAAVQSSVDAGSLDGSRTYKTWRTVGDSRVRDAHKAMNGERVRWDELFSNGLDIPGEYNCRCLVSYRITPSTG